ncbi:MAG: cytidine deaminase [Gemmatimonadetes bacterium]|nr:MAG: cytidine deaminase [Gemmatimonadota bacterium]
MADRLIETARAAQRRAYCPYSHYQVGAALEAEDGTVFAGCNVENASYGLTICAERAAICSAVSAGAQRFRRLVVATNSEPPAPPCGACRQVLAEFGAELLVEAVGPTRSKRWTMRELLPDAFTGELLR